MVGQDGALQVAPLGPLEVRDGAGTPLTVGGRRARALLALLALRAGPLGAGAAA